MVNDTELRWREALLEGRPHERESQMSRYADSRVRALVLATFPLSVILLWPLVSRDELPIFLGALAWIVVTNAAGYLVPWRRLPRWAELLPPLSTIPALTLLVAPAGGLADGYAYMLAVPMMWLAFYADARDIAVGYVISALCLLAPLAQWFEVLPPQGTARQTAFFLVHLLVVIVGIRPIITPLRDQLRRNRRAMDALHASQATLVHDLRNPLGAIHSLATLTRQRAELHGSDPAFPDKVGEYAGVIATSAERAEQIIEAVLELSRAGEQLPRIDTIDLPRLIDDVAVGFPGVRVQTSGAPRTIVGHQPSIERLFANLLENAEQHARDAGSTEARRVLVTVSGREVPAGWLVTVTDDGRGFEPTEIDSLFEPWRRGAEPGAAGSGLGLAIVDGIVAQHGGTISASNAQPRGASFTFTLARRPSVAAGAPEPSTTTTA